jgi:hypothetical protein
MNSHTLPSSSFVKIRGTVERGLVHTNFRAGGRRCDPPQRISFPFRELIPDFATKLSAASAATGTVLPAGDLPIVEGIPAANEFAGCRWWPQK